MSAITHEDDIPAPTGTPWWERVTYPTVRIVARPVFGTTVTIDGVDIRGVKNVQWSAPVGDMQRVVLTLILKPDVTTDVSDIPGAAWVRKLEEPGHIAVTILTHDVTVTQYDEEATA